MRSPFFLFTDPATTAIYTLSLHDALPILRPMPSVSTAKTVSENPGVLASARIAWRTSRRRSPSRSIQRGRSEEHTSELQSRLHLVCRLLLEKKKNTHAQHQRAHTDAAPPH